MSALDILTNKIKRWLGVKEETYLKTSYEYEYDHDEYCLNETWVKNDGDHLPRIY